VVTHPSLLPSPPRPRFRSTLLVLVYNTAMNPRRWSLKRQIQTLGALAVVTLVLVAVLGVFLLRQTESARVADADRQLERAVTQLVERYDYLRTAFDEQRTTTPLRSGDDGLLRLLAEVVLAAYPGVEGGFYAVESTRLLGYAYPTYQGSGRKTDVPAAEQPTIMRVAEAAVTVRGAAHERVDAGPDLILFRAQAVLESGQPVGAVWLMDRLRDVRDTRRQLYLLGLIGLLSVSGGVAAGAWFLTSRLDRGISAIETGIRAMEDRLDAPVPAAGIPELDRLGSAINRLALALQDNQARRADIEQRLRQADRLATLGRLVAGVAHEVRNPLASIRLKLHLARGASADPDRLAQAFTVIQEEIDRMDRLVERLLSLGKPSEPSRLPTDLSRFLAERLELWEARAKGQGTVLELQPVSSISEPVLLGRDRVGQILDNLVGNALEALTDRGGRITVEAARPRVGEIVIAVADTGPGVPSDAVDRIFEPFFTTRNGGTGLGLFLSAELARQLGGDLRYCNQPEGGARFEVRLPC